MESYPIILISGEYNAFKTGFNGAGAYMCSGLYQSDNFKLPIYIGGAENLQRRITLEHIPELKRQVHDNPIFQSSWDKHQGNGFVWWLLEASTRENSLIIEQKWLNAYHPFEDERGGFNIAHDAMAPWKGKKLSAEHIDRRRQTVIQNETYLGRNNPFFGKRHSAASKQKIAQSQRNLYLHGYVNPNKGKHVSVGINNPKFDHHIYIFKNKTTHEIFQGTRYDFYQKYNLHSKNVGAMIRGKQKSANGWILCK